MKIDLRKLYAFKTLDINSTLNIDEKQYKNAGIIRMSEILVKGKATIDYEDNIILDLNLTGHLIMPCAISLEEVSVPLNITINDTILENTIKDEFYLDLFDILWENIVLEIPIKVVKEGVQLKNASGDGWSLEVN